MIPDIGTVMVFALGILVGMILGNKDFRYKFFKGLRGFLAGLGKSARNYNTHYSGSEKREIRREGSVPARERPEVQHIYKQVHTPKPCPTCQGSGRVYEKLNPMQEGAPGIKPKAITCPDCEGEGRVWD